MILFLDFDGVLHIPGRAKPFEYLPLLEAALEPYPTIRIVISSSWQASYKEEYLVEFLGPTLAPRYAGMTSSAPVAPEILASQAFSNWPAIEMLRRIERHSILDAPPGTRQREIEAWMAANATDSESWLALDDVAINFDEGCRQVVILDLMGTLVTKEFEKLSAALRDPESVPPVSDPFFEWWRRATSVPILPLDDDGERRRARLEDVPEPWRHALQAMLRGRNMPMGGAWLVDWCEFLGKRLRDCLEARLYGTSVLNELQPHGSPPVRRLPGDDPKGSDET